MVHFYMVWWNAHRLRNQQTITLLHLFFRAMVRINKLTLGKHNKSYFLFLSVKPVQRRPF